MVEARALAMAVIFVVVEFVTLVISSTERDVAVLLRVKDGGGLGDPDGRNATSRHAPCDWTGIACESKHHAVVSIDLSGLNLAGTFPAGFCRIPTLRNLSLGDNNLTVGLATESISLCSHLRVLNLSSNYFAGELPEFEPGFGNLTVLDLSTNAFTGCIPGSFRRFRSLRVLSLVDCTFSCPLPEFLTELTELRQLNLTINEFGGQLPRRIGNLTKLEILWVSAVGLTGTIPDSIGELVSLTDLDLSGNYLTGEIPYSIGRLKSVVQIELYMNNLSGQLPISISNLTSLRRIDVSQNNLTGELPESIAGMPLESLCLNDNHFEGSIPKSLASNPNLSELKLFNNSFSGHLPVDLGRESEIVEFDVSSNEFIGSLPPDLCFKGKLQRLIAFSNKFTGPIPESYGKCSSITYVRIEDNELSGVVPLGLWSNSNLQLMKVENNRLEGEIPHSISAASDFLAELSISSNNFSGSLPSEICQLKELVNLNASWNRFTGNLPKCMTEMSSLQNLNLQDNSFTGEIPTDVGSWKSLLQLDLANNRLDGEIPGELGSLPELTYLDLSGNLFKGEIRPELTKLKLSKFNVSNNRLEGEVPAGFNNKFYVDSLLGNPDLCSWNLEPLPPCHKHKSVSLYTIAVPLALALSLIALVVCFFKRKLLTIILKKDESLKVTTFQQVDFNEADLLPSLTEENLIGSGGSGEVFRVKIREGLVVAVKRLRTANTLADMKEVFQSEMEILGMIRHVNVVKLLMSCTGEDLRVLVYEYMENGSLGDILHGEKGGLLLTWPKRFFIAVGAAQGLAYLHHDCVPPILHRDVKANNILLDEEFRPRVADFGLSKTLQQDVNGVDAAMSCVAGSCGYIAPEYAYTLKVNEKSDVYSFGVVLLELITGKRPTADSFGENKDIVMWAREVALSSQPEVNGGANNPHIDLGQLIDSRMDISTCNYEEIKKVLKISLLCTSPSPANRPTMRRVVELLKGLCG